MDSGNSKVPPACEECSDNRCREALRAILSNFCGVGNMVVLPERYDLSKWLTEAFLELGKLLGD